MASSPNDTSDDSPSNWYRFVFFVLITAGLAAAFRWLPLQTYLTDLLQWIQGLGWLGGVFIVVIYVVATVAFIPGSLITLGTGYIYGVVWATVIVSIGSTIGAALAFLAGRFFARDFVHELIEDYPTFRAVDSALEEESFKIVFLLRLVPILPFNVINYAFGLTNVSFWKYVLASWIGMIPGTIMYAYFGSLAEKLTRLAAGQPEASVPVWDVGENLRRAFAGEFGGGVATNLFYWIGLVATISVTVIITRKARAELDRLTNEESVPPVESD